MTSSQDRYSQTRATLGGDLLSKLHTAKLLVVGAGGIGCELLKNLVLSGFLDIEVVDLDTIDVSNLNRQFLFRPDHVGQSKAKVAAAAVQAFNPDARVAAHHGNIKSPQFGLSFVGKFDLVLNALDNVDARRHVNRLCLARGKPLIESGTTGYLGQVAVIQKGESECYECQPKATQKTYPICTIRSTPDKPVHCVVWAKELFRLLFGRAEDSMLYEDPRGDEPSAYMEACVGARPPPGSSVEAITAYAAAVLGSQFEAEIAKRVGMGVYKGARAPPRPLDATALTALAAQHGKAPTRKGEAGWDRKVWGLEESARELSACLHDVYGSDDLCAHVGSMEFDKDDKIAMRFVTAACNLRSLVFHITPQSYHDAKGIAGNIIPAIATTNAIIAGLQVLEAIKIIQAAKPLREACKYVYCLREATRKGLLLQPTALEPPNPSCFVCSTASLDLHCDTAAFTLGDLVTKVLKGRLGVNEPSISIGASIVYEEGEDANEGLKVNLTKALAALPGGGAADGVSLSVEDFSQDLEMTLCVYHKVLEEEAAPEGFVVGGVVPTAKPTSPVPKQAEPAAAAAAVTVAAPTPTKRAREEDGGGGGGAAAGEPSAKRHQPDTVDVSLEDDVVDLLSD